MTKAEERAKVMKAVIQKYYDFGIDQVTVVFLPIVDIVLILSKEEPESLACQFWKNASDRQWTLLQREFRMWQKNEPSRRALQISWEARHAH